MFESARFPFGIYPVCADTGFLPGVLCWMQRGDLWDFALVNRRESLAGLAAVRRDASLNQVFW